MWFKTWVQGVGNQKSIIIWKTFNYKKEKKISNFKHTWNEHRKAQFRTINISSILSGDTILDKKCMVTYIHKFLNEKKMCKAKICKTIITVSYISKLNVYLSINTGNLIQILKTNYVYMHKITFGKTCVTSKYQWVGFGKKEQFSSYMGWDQYANTVRCLICLLNMIEEIFLIIFSKVFPRQYFLKDIKNEIYSGVR